MQETPLVLHAVPHTPLLHERPVQQSALEPQESPLVLQVPHLPLRHWYPLQQSPLEAQVEPDPAQGLAQVPPLHSSPPQHSLE